MTGDLSTRERQEVTRFGMFDAEILAEIEEHADDTLPCQADSCDKPAEFSLSMRCCGADKTLVCDPHYVAGREFYGTILAGRRSRCRYCKHTYPIEAAFDDIYRVVGPL